MIPSELIHNGARKRVAFWQAEWSLSLATLPHRLWITNEGEEKVIRFTSDNKGSFAELDEVANA